MNDPERPPLDPLAIDEIRASVYQIDEKYFPLIGEFRIAVFIPLSSPVPLPRPAQFVKCLQEYASSLFTVEADLFEQFRGDGRYPQWIRRLMDRIVVKVSETVEKIDQGNLNVTVWNHGIMQPDIKKAVEDVLSKLTSQYEWKEVGPPIQFESPKATLTSSPENPVSNDPANWSPLHRFIEAGKQIKKLMEGPHQEIHESTVRQVIAQQDGIKPEEVTWPQIQFEVSGLLPYYPAIRLIPSASQKESEKPRSRKRWMADPKEISRRANLLAEYKAATGNPSHKRIYESNKAGIHKPQFYEWLNGTLPSDSQTTKNLERFLSDRKPPVSRKPKD
jgi:hypothetical protein